MENTEPTTFKELRAWAKSNGYEWAKASGRPAFPWIIAREDGNKHWYILTKGKSELDLLRRAYRLHHENPFRD